jgi:DNA-binding MarR family transcriptional regulator
MSREKLQPSHIPDYQRLLSLTKKIPELEPDEIMMYELLRAIAGEMVAQLKASHDRFGLSEGRLRVLSILLDHDGPTTHTELAKSSGVTKGTITGLVDGLERDGYVCRSASLSDRRVSHIEITKEGEQMLRKFLPGHIRRLSELVGVISKADQKKLLKLLQKLRAGLFDIDQNKEGEDAA